MLLCLFLPANVVEAAQLSSAESAVISIESYQVEEGVLTPGEQITINLVLRNNSATTAAQNAVVTFESANYALLPVYGEANQAYVGTVEAGETKEIMVKAIVNQSYNADMAHLRCDFNYVSGSTPLSNSTAIYIPTYAYGNLIAESTVVAESATIGAKSLISIKYRNASTVNITDAKLVITGNVAEENAEIDLSTIAAGKTYTQDYYVAFTQTGIQTVNLQYIYTDGAGNQNVIACGEYKVNVVENTAVMPTSTVVKEGVTSTSTMLSVAVLAVALMAGALVIALFIKKKI